MSLELLPLDLGVPGLRAFTSTRQGGASQGAYASLNLGLNTEDDPAAVLENRRRLWEAAGLQAGRTVFMRQVHGDALRVAGAAEAGRGSLALDQALPDCDALVTTTPGLALAVGHADCLAIVAADAQAGVLGVAHAGWRGALAGIAGKLARTMVKDHGAQPGRLRAGLSVCLGPQDLRLGEEQHRLFKAADPQGLASYSSALVQGHFTLDLWACCRRQLEAEGLASQAIVEQPWSTAADSQRFFSHRRDQGKTGRMLTLAWLDFHPTK